jgi:mono/diheme cytochrome c family protein
VLAKDPSTLIRLVLGGGAMAGTQAAPSRLGMPAFAWRLSDEDTAQVLTFIRSSWGNRATAVAADQVAGIRRSLQPATAN